MDILTALSAKVKMQKEIRESILNYENMFGLDITGIELQRFYISGEQKADCSIKLQVVLP